MAKSSASVSNKMMHFGLVVRPGPKHGLHIDRNTYALINKRSSHWFPKDQDPELWEAQTEIFDDPDHRFYTDEWCEKHRISALANFDVNMDRFSELSPDEFEMAINSVLKKNKKFVSITDLTTWTAKNTLYIMVLDRFLQVYVGVAAGRGGLKGRIRQHWSSDKKFDRLLHGTVESSIIPIDSFRALDTTRIFALETKSPALIENKILEQFPSRFVLNRIAGGQPTSTEDVARLDYRRQVFLFNET